MNTMSIITTRIIGLSDCISAGMAPHDMWNANPIFQNEYWFDYLRFLEENLGYIAADLVEESETDFEVVSVGSADDYEREEIFESSDDEDDDILLIVESIIDSVIGPLGSRNNPIDLTLD